MIHFAPEEYADRLARTRAEMADRELDGLLLFAQESQYWLTGYDTFGFCFFQCLVVSHDRVALLTRSADRLQAALTSDIADVRIWRDGVEDPTADLAALLEEMGLGRARLGWETDTHGLTAMNGRRVAVRLRGRAELVECSDLISTLRLTKSPAETGVIRHAAALCDAAYDAALPLVKPGADEAEILAAMQGAVLAAGGDYPANEWIIGSGDHALLCRYSSGRRSLEARDQITFEWGAAWRHYHVCAMRTVTVGAPRPEHVAMHEAAREALLACEAALRPGARMGEVFAEHARVFEARGLRHARLNACGYSLGARFAPSWMEREMFVEGAPWEIAENGVYFLHMILADAGTGAAMSLGRTSLVGPDGAEPLSRLPLDLPVV